MLFRRLAVRDDRGFDAVSVKGSGFVRNVYATNIRYLGLLILTKLGIVNIWRKVHNVLVVLVLVLSALGCSQDTDTLYDGFVNPPEDTRPWVYWYWIDENISMEGITKDLEAMARVGIGQALIGHISPGSERGETKILSKEWWDMVAFAVKEGHRLGVDIGFFNGPGWSQSGGPWIELDHSMRHIVATETRVRGPRTIKERLPEPGADFQRVAVQAFSVDPAFTGTPDISLVRSYPETRNTTHLADGDTSTAYQLPENILNSGVLTLEFQAKQQATIQAIKLDLLPVPLYADVEFQKADSSGRFTTARTFTIDRRNINFQIGPRRFDPASFSVPTQRSDKFRLVFRNIKASHGAGFREIELHSGSVVDQYIDKQLGKMASDPIPPWDAYLWPDQAEPLAASAIRPEDVVDLTSFVDSSGILRWEVPAGEWVILNTGMAPTGSVNVPVPPEATGFECDKFSKEATGEHFNAYIGKFLEDIPEDDRKALKTVVIDSYEVGSQNWSDEFEEIFSERFGYDPIPWLPVFSGRIVKSADLSNRFLWDVRRLTADLIAENYVETLREMSNSNGLNLWLENYGHWGFPAEFLQYGGRADMISGEFWFENSVWDLGPPECRAASSAAHIYGKNRVFAEAFTAGFNFKQYPGSMKSRGDRMFCEGINHFVLHLYIHQPWDDRVPGVTAWFGMSLQRHNTWFEQSKVWIDYMRRCHYLLQQGDPVTDVCYFIGEDAPKMTGPFQPVLPRGYDYDFINAEVLERSHAEDGHIVLPEGKKYRLLILPDLETMRPELLEKIGKLIAGGANVYGPAPSRSPSLAGYPDADRAVARLSQEIWGNAAAGTAVDLRYGKGRIYNGQDLARVLEEISLAPDVICADTAIMWTHRSAKDLDIYFLSNQGGREVNTQVSFRVRNRTPEFWDPNTGSTSAASRFRSEGDRTVVPVRLDPDGSVFVVFRKSGSGSAYPLRNEDASATSGIIVAVEDPWHLYFPENWDAPDSIRVADLISWTEFPQPGIKYFSGTATYRNTFTLPDEYPNDNSRIMLDLGHVGMMAEVLVNGKNLGILWTKPYKVDITEAANAGVNRLEIRITNTWWNRLVGDEKYPSGFPGSVPGSPKTFATVKAWTADDPLLESGLIGPVVVRVDSR